MARYRKHNIRYDDTLQLLAQDYMGDARQWKVIADYNDLEYPYIVNDPKDKLKNPEHLMTVGDEIIIPIEQNLRDTNVKDLGKRSQEKILDLTFGSDLDTLSADTFRKEGNYEYWQTYGTDSENMGFTGNGRGDIKTATGVDNVKQAVIRRLLTPKGSLLLHPGYGSNLQHYLGMKVSYGLLNILDNEIQATIKQDGRVRDVKKNSSEIDGEVYSGSFTVDTMTVEDSFNLLINAENNNVYIY